jgi:outer membrane protein assembly factor BamB
MQSDAIQTQTEYPAESLPRPARKPPRLWPALALLLLFWTAEFLIRSLDMPYFYRFLSSMAVPALLILSYFIWWWASRRIPILDRLYGFALIVGSTALAIWLCHPSLGWFGMLSIGLPVVLTVWTLWLLLVKKTALSWSRLGGLVLVLVAWTPFLLIRNDGVNADLQGDTRWRWSPTAEDLFLAEKARSADATTPGSPAVEKALVLGPGDWPEFRGPERDGVVHGVAIATDWRAHPPRLLWRQRVGPAWSSVIVIGDRLFTQEQLGEQETVVGYDAVTGRELWVHEDAARFWESVSGAGPRATPTFADGRIYTLGATGILNCLDAATGKRHWTRDITADAGARKPIWGFSGSPLVVDDKVIVYGSGAGDKNLLAYRRQSGEPAWTAPAGHDSYSSPQRAMVAGTPQVLIVNDEGLTAVEPGSGTRLWHHGLAMPGAPRTLQPHLVGPGELVVGTLEGPGVARIEVGREADAWKVTPRWASSDMKPEFPDFVVHQGHAYGFDVNIFCCIDLANGKRNWKAGRYGRGQVVLLAEEGLLLVLSESGEAVLLPANSERHEELARYRVLDGKTWNHPVLAHGRLYVRNAEEMACYEMGPATGVPAGPRIPQ